MRRSFTIVLLLCALGLFASCAKEELGGPPLQYEVEGPLPGSPRDVSKARF